MPDLFAAVQNVDLQTASLLLRQGGNANQTDGSGMTPLQQWASIPGHDSARLVSMLVLHGADVDAHHPGTGMTPLRLAAKFGNILVVKALAGLGADLSVRGRLSAQAVHTAVQFGHCDVVEYLIDEATRARGEQDADNRENAIGILATMWDDNKLTRENDCTLLHFAAASNDAGKKWSTSCSVGGWTQPLHQSAGELSCSTQSPTRRRAT